MITHGPPLYSGGLHRGLEGQMPDIRDLEIDLIQTDVDQIQTRLGLNEERIAILCEKYKEKGAAAFPPPVVYRDVDGVYWLADGHYRLAAIRKSLGPEAEDQHVVQVEVREGSVRDAAFYAATANSEHPTQLTWEEMRRLVIRFLRDAEWSQMGDREIARHVGASHTYVNKIHHELDEQDASGNGLQMPPSRKVKTQRSGKPFETTVDKKNRRHSKAKTETIATPPNSPEDPQDEPATVEDEERAADDNEEIVIDDSNDLTAVPDTDVVDEHTAQDNPDAATTDDHHDLKVDRENDEDDEPGSDPPKGFVDLIAAWLPATAEGRRIFLAWARHRKIDEPAGETTPEKHAKYHLMGAEVIKDLQERHAAMRKS